MPVINILFHLYQCLFFPLSLSFFFVTLFDLMFKTQYYYIHELTYISIQSKFCSYFINFEHRGNIIHVIKNEINTCKSD